MSLLSSLPDDCFIYGIFKTLKYKDIISYLLIEKLSLKKITKENWKNIVKNKYPGMFSLFVHIEDINYKVFCKEAEITNYNDFSVLEHGNILSLKKYWLVYNFKDDVRFETFLQEASVLHGDIDMVKILLLSKNSNKKDIMTTIKSVITHKKENIEILESLLEKLESICGYDDFLIFKDFRYSLLNIADTVGHTTAVDFLVLEVYPEDDSWKFNILRDCSNQTSNYSFITDKTFTEINVKDNKNIEFSYFEDGKFKIISLEAFGDCCSESWFESTHGKELENLEASFAQLKNCEIIEFLINENDPCDYLPISNVQEYDEKKSYIILAEDEVGDPVEIRFLLINSSNGYYSGWIEFYNGERKIYYA